MTHPLNFPPRLMQATAAATYIGVSVSKFYSLKIQPKRHNGNVLYDRIDLDAWADSLPYEGQGENTCDAVFTD